MALQRYLQAAVALRPKLALSSPTEQTSSVTWTGGRGEVFLRDQGKAAHRLRWNKDGDGARAVAPGTYGQVGYRLVRDNWVLSVSSPGDKPLELSAKPEKLDVSDHVVVKVAAKREGGRIVVNGAVTSPDGRGASLYHKGRRLQLRVALETVGGRKIVEHALAYG